MLVYGAEEARSQALSSYKINPNAQQALQAIVKSKQSIERGCAFKFNDNIYIVLGRPVGGPLRSTDLRFSIAD